MNSYRSAAPRQDNFQAISQSSKLMMLVRNYAVYGHMNAKLDPLSLYETYKNTSETYENKFKVPDDLMKKRVDYRTYGFTEEDLDKEFFIDYPDRGGLLS
jgi:2-oxoglutarate dehydrogenase complex dehydrogenase (E1) component-like enzyme